VDREPTIIPPFSLLGFCATVQSKHTANWPPTEMTIATEFVEYFKLEPIVFMGRLEELCQQLKITLRVTSLPECLRGHNYRFENQREILISENQTVRGTEVYTALHEMRELLEYEFRDLGSPICQANDKEQRADEFATSVQICAFAKEIPGLLDQASGIESNWRRWAVYALLIVGSLMYGLTLAVLPLIEDIQEKNRPRRIRA
jgi:hypothetical protein